MGKLSSASTVADLKNSLKKEIGAEKEVQKLLLGDKVLQEHQSLEASGLVGGAEVKAIVGSKPVLFVGESQASWGLFDEDKFPDDDEKRDIDEAPEVVRAVAKEMIEAAPYLANTPCSYSDEGSHGGRIIVIAHPGDDPKKACLKGLKISKDPMKHGGYAIMDPNKCEERFDADDDDHDDDDENDPVSLKDPECTGLWAFATFSDEDWSKKLEIGFNADPEEEDLDDEDSEEKDEDSEVIIITKIMSEKLERHFSFGFDSDVVVAPQFYGGYASDGNIVGVLSKRVWT